MLADIFRALSKTWLVPTLDLSMRVVDVVVVIVVVGVSDVDGGGGAGFEQLRRSVVRTMSSWSSNKEPRKRLKTLGPQKIHLSLGLKE